MIPRPRTPLRAGIAAAVLTSLLACAALAQESPTPDERREYAAGLAALRTLIAAKDWPAAAARAEALVSERPREPQARFLKGVIQTERGDAEGAIATFRALIEDYPEIPEPYNNLAALYAQRGALDTARTLLETAVKTAPDWALAHENLGDVHARIAADHYRRAAELDKTSRTAAAKLQLARQLFAPATRP